MYVRYMLKNKGKKTVKATIFSCVAVFAESQGGCGMRLKMGFRMVEESEKCSGGRGLAAVAVVRVSVYQLARKRLQLVLSHLRPTSFLEVGWWRCDCTVFDGCLDVWGSNRCIEEGKIGGGKERENSHQGALGIPVHLVSGSDNRKNCFHNTAVTASAHSAVLSWACFTLKPQRGLQSEAGVMQIKDSVSLCSCTN